AMSLANAGAIDLYDAMIWVYGANIGTTFTAILAASNSNYVGRQVAWAHFFYKTVSVIILWPFTNQLIELLNLFDTSPARMTANGHLIFNLISSIIFFPFIDQGARFIEKLYPASAEETFGAEYLSQNHYQSSALAVSYGQREILRLADIVHSMIRDCLKIFKSNDPALIESIRERDKKVDFLYKETKMFLLDHANKSSSAVNQTIMNLIMFASDLERAADAIDINITALAIKKHALKIEFSAEGWDEIVKMHEALMRTAATAINAYTNKEMCSEAIQLKRELSKMETELRERHIERLNKGIRETINTSSIHLDLLSEFRRIGSLLCAHTYLKNGKEGNA
ncbi:MAG: Na/Pi symporter, partial [Bdellovibrionaceae bacterium]|nr:Na/Pi symporter [Pseudobdellovibrionaceae bacterium]